MDHVTSPEQGLQCMADFSPAHNLRPSMAPVAACVPNTQVLLCPSLLLSVSDHRSFVEKIPGTTKQSVVIEFLDGVGAEGRRRIAR